MAFLTGKKLLLLGFIIVLLIIIPLTVYLVQQQQETTTQAAQTSILSVSPAPPQSMSVGASKDFQIRLNPVSNQVSFVKVNITYDPAKLETSIDRIVINSAAFQPPLQGPTVASGNISFTVSVGSEPSKVIQSETLVATITFKALVDTAGSTTPITINRTQSQVLSIASADQFNENVLATVNSGSVTIVPAAGAASPSPSPSPSPTASPSTTSSPTPSPASGAGTGTGTGTGAIITVSPTPSPTATPSATITPEASPITSLPDVGPGDFLAKIGGGALLFTIIGVILLLAL